MRVLFAVLDAGLGGHTRSSVSIAQALRARGHDIIYCVGAHSQPRLIAESGFPYETLDPGYLGDFPSARRRLCSIIHARTLDAVHAFGLTAMGHIVSACATARIPRFLTICGGQAPRHIAPLEPTILFSHELREQLVRERGIPEHCLTVIPSRIDLPAIEDCAQAVSPVVHDEFRRKYNIESSSSIILRISRADAPYLESILQGVEVAARLRARGITATFVHLGYEEAPWVLQAVQHRIAEANSAARATVAVTAQDEAPRALQYVQMANVVFGTGRSAFEAMALRKPTLVIGPRGFAGTVAPDTVARLAYYNFSGRNVAQATPRADSIAAAAAEVERILRDAREADRLGSFGRQYVQHNLDVGLAAARYEALYRDYRVAPQPLDWRTVRRLSVPVWRLLARRLISRNIRSWLLQRAGNTHRRFQRIRTTQGAR